MYLCKSELNRVEIKKTKAMKASKFIGGAVKSMLF